MKAFKTAHRRQKGATLLEALAFLGIAAIVIVGAIAMFRSAQGSAQSNDMVQQLAGLRGNIKTLFSSQAQYGLAAGAPGNGAMNQTMINAKAVPDTLRVNGAVINNMWNGVVQLDGNTSDFWIRYTNVPQEVCVKVAPQTGSSWQGLTINANAEVATDAAVFSVANATAQCAAGANNTMTWRGR